MIYFIEIGLLILFSIIESSYDHSIKKNKAKATRVLFILAASMIILTSGLRYETGQDWSSYLEIFNNVDSKVVWSTWEHGYLLLNQLFGLFTENYYLLQFFINVVCGTIVFGAIYKESDRPVFTLLIYCMFNFNFLVDMTVNRMYIAIAILTLGRKCIEKKKIVLWILFVFLAIQFHVTAILAFPLYFTSRIKVSWKTSSIIIGISFLLNIVGAVFTQRIVEMFMHLSFLPDRLKLLLVYYSGNSQYNGGVDINTGIGLIIIYLFYIIIVLSHKKESDLCQDKYELNFLIGVFISGIAKNFALLGRVSFYYYISGFGLLSYNTMINTLSFCDGRIKFTKRTGSIIVSTFILVQLAFYVKSWFSGYVIDYYPYQTFLFK